MKAALESAGLPPDLVPDHPKMVGVVKAAAAQSHAAIHRKRGYVRATIDSASYNLFEKLR